MRVLHILGQLRASGAEQMLRVAAPYWQAAGLDLDVLETSTAPGHFAGQLEAAGFRVHHLALDKRPHDITKLRALMHRQRYDVVHIHPEQADLIPGLAARLAGVPVVIRTVHHIFPYTGMLRLRKEQERRLNRVLGTRFICNSRSGSANERTALKNPHRLVYNWFDDQHFSPPSEEQRAAARRSLELENHETVFVSLGGCAAYKNHDLILQALVDVLGATYLHAGPEPDDSERRLAAELGVSDRARFLGVVPDARDVLHAADVYLMPSTIEGFGVAAVEALGCGVPAIFSDRPALWDLKGIVPATWVPLEREPLAAAMRLVASRPDHERKSEGAEASRIVRAQFGVARGAQGYLDAYRDALALR
jgi:glycosyltransferase involved in cell wall biosynthesis